MPRTNKPSKRLDLTLLPRDESVLLRRAVSAVCEEYRIAEPLMHSIACGESRYYTADDDDAVVARSVLFVLAQQLTSADPEVMQAVFRRGGRWFLEDAAEKALQSAWVRARVAAIGARHDLPIGAVPFVCA